MEGYMSDDLMQSGTYEGPSTSHLEQLRALDAGLTQLERILEATNQGTSCSYLPQDASQQLFNFGPFIQPPPPAQPQEANSSCPPPQTMGPPPPPSPANSYYPPPSYQNNMDYGYGAYQNRGGYSVPPYQNNPDCSYMPYQSTTPVGSYSNGPECTYGSYSPNKSTDCYLGTYQKDYAGNSHQNSDPWQLGANNMHYSNGKHKAESHMLRNEGDTDEENDWQSRGGSSGGGGSSQKKRRKTKNQPEYLNLDEQNTSKNKKASFMRKNIRDIIEEGDLDAETLAAQKEEQERIRRLNEAHQRAMHEHYMQMMREKEQNERMRREQHERMRREREQSQRMQQEQNDRYMRQDLNTGNNTWMTWGQCYPNQQSQQPQMQQMQQPHPQISQPIPHHQQHPPHQQQQHPQQQQPSHHHHQQHPSQTQLHQIQSQQPPRQHHQQQHQHHQQQQHHHQQQPPQQQQQRQQHQRSLPALPAPTSVASTLPVPPPPSVQIKASPVPCQQETQMHKPIISSMPLSTPMKGSDVILVSSDEEAHSIETPTVKPAVETVPKKDNDVIDISSSDESESGMSSTGDDVGHEDSKDDDVMVISDKDDDDDDDQKTRDPNTSGSHTNDVLNQPDAQGRVLVNVGHPPNDQDVFLAPQLGKAVKPHQIGGIRFLYDNIIESLERFKVSSGFGCILAHSMGLGKTLQVIAFIDVFLRYTSGRTVICIVPINTIQNWMAEFNIWLPTREMVAEPYITTGEVLPRSFAVYLLNDSYKTTTSRAKAIADWKNQGGVLLLGYEMYRMLALKKVSKKKMKKGQPPPVAEDDSETKKLLEDIYSAIVNPGPDLVICDEGHRIKNCHANTATALKSIKTKRRVVLTGYPLQNNLLEYWCMVDFVRPNYLGSRAEFCNMFERPILNGQCIDSTPRDRQLMRYRAHVLHSLLEGFVQRRGHSILKDSLPKKEEHVLLVRMTPVQRALYNAFVKDILLYNNTTNPLIFFSVCCKIWNHPDILFNIIQGKKVNDNDLDIDLMSPTLPQQPGRQNRKKKNVVNGSSEPVPALTSSTACIPTTSTTCSTISKMPPNIQNSPNIPHIPNIPCSVTPSVSSPVVYQSTAPAVSSSSSMMPCNPPQISVSTTVTNVTGVATSSAVSSMPPNVSSIPPIESVPPVQNNFVAPPNPVMQTSTPVSPKIPTSTAVTPVSNLPNAPNTPTTPSAGQKVNNAAEGVPPVVTTHARERGDTHIGYEWAKPIMADYKPGVLENSYKMTILFAIIEHSLGAGDKILIFSQSLYTLDLIERFLTRREVPLRPGLTRSDSNGEKWQRSKHYFRLDGSTSAQEREKLINEFNRNPEISLFLLSTRAGCLGINLTGANRIVVFDASWNPCHDAQAVCRVYRYGQRKACYIYRLVTDNSLEKKIYDRQVNKQGMSDRVVDELNPESNFTWKEVSTLICEEQDDPPVQDFSEGAAKYDDHILRHMCMEMNECISKEPFQHESLLLDRKDQKLTKEEKKLAKQSYEMEKRANTYSRPNYTVYYPNNTTGAFNASSNLHRPWCGNPGMANIRPSHTTPVPMQLANANAARQVRNEHSAASDVFLQALQRQGMQIQKVIMPSDVNIPINTQGLPSVSVSAGREVLVMKTPKGIYLRLPDGRIVSVRLPVNPNANRASLPANPTKPNPNPIGPQIPHTLQARLVSSNDGTKTVVLTKTQSGPGGQSIGVIRAALQCGGTVRLGGQNATVTVTKNATTPKKQLVQPQKPQPEVIQVLDDDSEAGEDDAEKNKTTSTPVSNTPASSCPSNLTGTSIPIMTTSSMCNRVVSVNSVSIASSSAAPVAVSVSMPSSAPPTATSGTSSYSVPATCSSSYSCTQGSTAQSVIPQAPAGTPYTSNACSNTFVTSSNSCSLLPVATSSNATFPPTPPAVAAPAPPLFVNQKAPEGNSEMQCHLPQS